MDDSPPTHNVNETQPRIPEQAAPDLEEIWKSIETNKKAILGAESSIVQLLEIIKQTDVKHQTSNELREREVNTLKEIEKKYDDKPTVFMNAYEKHVNEKIKNLIL